MSATLFDGITIDPVQDNARLSTALEKVKALMADGRARTLTEIAKACGCSEAGASARLRDLRKSKHGSHTVISYRVEGGLWMYRVLDEVNA